MVLEIAAEKFNKLAPRQIKCAASVMENDIQIFKRLIKIPVVLKKNHYSI